MEPRVQLQDMTDLERAEMMNLLEKCMRAWTFRVEKGDLSGLSVVPPLEILMIPG